jgi:4-hydroxy 2-oxovalerate aldolase
MTLENTNLTLLDCTLRDGGYYNAWDFSPELINQYLAAMKAAQVDVVELGFRFLKNEGFKGPCAFTTDVFVRSLDIPSGLTIGVMLNGADLCTEMGWQAAMEHLFPEASNTTPVDLVRFACHFHELPNALSAASWLVERGYRVGLNLMQIADRTQAEVEQLGELASASAIEVLYFADSMGSMTPDDAARIIGWLRTHWSGPLGIHTHDNMGLALANTLRAQAEGATWLDATVTGMGRGPGNARMEELVIEAEALRGRRANAVPLMSLIRTYFGPMKNKHGWGTNPYYYLAGKHGIHPTYIQEMLGDARYDEEDILAVIDHLRVEGGKKFNFKNLEAARHFYRVEPTGKWSPREMISGRDVLLLGTGPGVAKHRAAIERYIRIKQPLVLALNTQTGINADLIDLRVACHPVRLLADCHAHTQLPQPLITPFSMLPDDVKSALGTKEVLDFGLDIQIDGYEFHETFCKAPRSLVMAYALGIAASGNARCIYLAGFDGYSGEDPRNEEMNRMVQKFIKAENSTDIIAVTPSRYDVKRQSIYGLIS